MLSRSLPLDANSKPVPLMPAVITLAQTYDTTVSSSTEITLNTSTTIIEITALAQAIFMKWGTADVTSSNWDHVLPAGTITSWVVPIDPTTGVRFTAVNFLEQAASATLCVGEF